MGNGAEKPWSEQLVLKWIKGTGFGQSGICQDCDRVGMWALSYFKAHSKLCKMRGTNPLLQLTQGKLLCDNCRNLGQLEQGKGKKKIFKNSFAIFEVALYSRNAETSHFHILAQNLLFPNYNKALKFHLKVA